MPNMGNCQMRAMLIKCRHNLHIDPLEIIILYCIYHLFCNCWPQIWGCFCEQASTICEKFYTHQKSTDAALRCNFNICDWKYPLCTRPLDPLRTTAVADSISEAESGVF